MRRDRVRRKRMSSVTSPDDTIKMDAFEIQNLIPPTVSNTIRSANPTSSLKKYLCILGVLISGFVIYYSREETRDAYAENFFCDADGTCHELPYEPSPRTIYSARSKSQYESWVKFHSKLKESAELYENRRSQSEHNQPSIVFLGDSITESWLGTSMDKDSDRAKGVPQVLEAKFSHLMDPLVLAISGDQTQHLLYRLIDGELLPAVSNDDSAVFVVMIGTNNLGAGELPGPTSEGIRAVVEYLLKNTSGDIFLFTLLPRGDGRRVLPRLCPPRCDKDGNPYESFMPPIEKVNAEIMNWKDELSNRFHILQCGDKFLSGETLDISLMPDLLHPNAAGHEILADCILNELNTMEK